MRKAGPLRYNRPFCTLEILRMSEAPQPIDQLISARWIIPVLPRNQVLEDHSVALAGNRIVALLPTAEAKSRFTPERHIELADHLLIPGLINAHGHAAMSLLRGYADDLELMDWLQNYIWPAEQQWIDYEFVREGTALAIAEMVRSGTTCFSELYFFPDGAAQSIADARIRAQICFPILQFPSAWAKAEEEYLHKGLQLHDDQRNSELINTAFGPHAPYTVSDEMLSRIVVLSAELEIPIHIHLHETRQEVEEAVAATGLRPLSRLHQLGMLSPQLQTVHMTQLLPEEIDLLAENSVHVIHCPESNLKLASGFCPVAELLGRGINVALGTDGAASNNDLDMFGEMKSAALLAKGVAQDPRAVSAHQALEMATINGAKAMGLEEELGSIETGKRADLVAVDLGHLEAQPVLHPLSQLVYTRMGSRVTDVWVDGEALMRGREFTRIDESELNSVARKWQEKLR